MITLSLNAQKIVSSYDLRLPPNCAYGNMNPMTVSKLPFLRMKLKRTIPLMSIHLHSLSPIALWCNDMTWGILLTYKFPSETVDEFPKTLPWLGCEMHWPKGTIILKRKNTRYRVLSVYNCLSWVGMEYNDIPILQSLFSLLQRIIADQLCIQGAILVHL